jgi:hypothetical protein
MLFLQKIRTMHRIFTLLFILISNLLLHSQLKQIIVLNEGAYDYINQQILVPVSVGSFNPTSGNYSKMNEIPGARFASDLIIDGNTYWVAADKNLINYDLKSHNKLKETIIEGIRKIAVHNDLIIVTRGEYQKPLNSYIQFFNKHTFELLFEIPAALNPYTAENIVVYRDFAYIAINNGFEFGKEVGKIIKVDLSRLEFVSETDLGSEARNPENLMLWENTLLTLNNKDFTGSSVSLMNLNSNEVSTFNLSNVNSLCGTSVLVGEQIIYQEIGKTELGAFHLHTKNSAFYKDPGISYYGMSYDAQSGMICTGQTDFRTTGIVTIYNESFDVIYTFNAGITPGYFVFDHSTPVQTKSAKPLVFDISPNPIISKCKVISNEPIIEVSVLDFYGRTLISTNQLSVNLEQIQPGPYVLMVKTKEKIGYKRFVKIRM